MCMYKGTLGYARTGIAVGALIASYVVLGSRGEQQTPPRSPMILVLRVRSVFVMF